MSSSRRSAAARSFFTCPTPHPINRRGMSFQGHGTACGPAAAAHSRTRACLHYPACAACGARPAGHRPTAPRSNYPDAAEPRQHLPTRGLSRLPPAPAPRHSPRSPPPPSLSAPRRVTIRVPRAAVTSSMSSGRNGFVPGASPAPPTAPAMRPQAPPLPPPLPRRRVA